MSWPKIKFPAAASFLRVQKKQKEWIELPYQKVKQEGEMENNVQEDYKSEILDIVRSNASPGIMRDKLEDYHENDLAEVFPELTLTERRKVYRILDIGMLSDIFEHIDEKQAAEYLDEMDIKKAAAILSGMETDAVVDVLRMTSKEKRPVLIALMDADARKDIDVYKRQRQEHSFVTWVNLMQRRFTIITDWILISFSDRHTRESP